MFHEPMTRARPRTPAQFPSQLIGALHCGDKSAIAMEVALSGIGAGIVAYHGIRPDGCCTCGDFTCADAGNHPDARLFPSGTRSATRDPRVARQWYETFPDRNMALALGSDLVGIDLDPRHGADLKADYGLPMKTMTARSGGGGRHRLYRLPRGLQLRGANLAPGVVLRTGNQALVIERSRHQSGGHYEWVKLTTPIIMLPEAAIHRLLSRTVAGAGAIASTDPVTFDATLSPAIRAEAARVRQEALRGKHGHQARLLLGGEWEAAGYPSQSEAEFNLGLLLSNVTDEPAVWHAVLRASGLGQRDRECRRNEHGRGNKLLRTDYIESLFSAVASRRAELRATGDPNLEPARRIFGAAFDRHDICCDGRHTANKRGSVIDAKKNPRGRPRGGLKRRAAMAALIRFLASEDVDRDRGGYVRVPVGAAAGAMGDSRETFRQALHDLIDRGLVESREPKAYVKNGRFAKDRCLRLLAPMAEALARIDQEGAAT